MMSKIAPVTAFLIGVLLFSLYVNPTYTGSIASAQAAIAGDDQALTASAQYAQKQNELVSAEKSIDPDALVRLEQFLPDSVNNVGLILDLDALAARDGLTLTSINVAAGQSEAATTVSSAPYGSVDMSLSASGSYRAFRSFLASIEQSSRLLDVRQLNVSGSDTGVYTYTMNLRLYWLH